MVRLVGRRIPEDYIMSDVPLTDCHLHLGGAIPTEFVWKALNELDENYFAETYEDVVAAMTFAPTEQPGFYRFLDKFKLLDYICWTPDLIRESIYAVSERLIAGNVEHAWIRFSIQKYLTYLKSWHRWELIQFIKKCFEEFAPGRVGLVLSLKYESPRANQRHMAELIRDSRVRDAVVGIDLVGDTSYYDAEFYASILHPWKDSGKLLFAHVGESDSSDNVMSAMKVVGVTEICHGIKAVTNLDALHYAADNDVCFHMALSSNILTGVVRDICCHPLPEFITRDVKVTIGTDDPVQCDTTLAREYSIARDTFGQSVVDILMVNANLRYTESL